MEGYKELLDKLNGLVNSLEKGELSLEELNELEAVTRTLHERSIILRYKAFESSVLGESEMGTREEVAPEPESTSADIEPVEMEAEVEEPDTPNESEEEPTFDFAIFDQDEETPETQSIDVSDTEPESEPEEIQVDIESTETEAVESEDEVSIEPEPEEAPTAEVLEVEAEISEPEPTPEPASEQEPAPASGNSFLDRFAQQDNSVAGRFSAGPLESLIGAFGLNERLRFINDLFDGSSEKFSDAIKALDSQSDLDAAKVKAAGYAEENEWDPEEEVVAEFMNYLNRRYA